ncbi:LptF/LptG family permease [Tenacibaculum sp. SDUM215027]|uniref:LptF/LptG family permease n=2 Tax=Bacteria TaxID=2 RepID=UPI003D314767
MKTLDRYILKSFLVPFLATFFIILFVLVMQALWLVFDNLAGKGISVEIVLKFLWYTTLIVAPQALPIGVLLSSIMTLGSLSENYEFAAAKSAGVSLQRMVRPIVFLAIFLSGINFLFLNYVYPYAMLKQLNMKVNIKKKQPAIALVAGSFNTEIPNFQIKFKEKYGEEDNLLKEVMIYDLSSKKGNNKIITAKRGEILSEEGSRYMTLVLKNGYYFEHHLKNGASFKEREKMPASYADFEKYTINIDISSFSNDDLEEEKYKTNYNMLSLAQLKDTLPTLKQNYDAFVNSRAKNLFLSIDVEDLHQYPDSLKNKDLSLDILENFELKEKRNILSTATSKLERTINNNKTNKDTLKNKRKYLNLYDIEFYNRVAFSLSCLLLFFIGAPLGSIIRKGGMGLPMILAIAIYVLYFFSNTFGRNLAEESSLTAITGSWLSVFLMLPLAITLTVRATKDKGLINLESIIHPFTNFILYFTKKRNTFVLYEYNVPLGKKANLYREQLNEVENHKLIKFIKNYHQYGYTKEFRQVAINILSEREGQNIKLLKETGQLENLVYKEVLKKVKEFKIAAKAVLFFWLGIIIINSLILVNIGFLGFFLLFLLLIIHTALLISVHGIYQRLNQSMGNKLTQNPLLFYTLGILLFFTVYYFSLNEIKEKLKTIT